MGRNKGIPKTGGRTKGTANKITVDMKEFVTMLLIKNQKQLERDFLYMEADDRWKIAEKLMQFVIPKQKSVENSISFDRLSDEQIDQVINGLVNSIADEEDTD
jgi:hypothetical protein